MCFSGCSHLQVHLSQADQHPGNEALPESCWHKTHLEVPLDGVVGLQAEAMDIHGRLGREEVGEQIAAVCKTGGGH